MSIAIRCLFNLGVHTFMVHVSRTLAAEIKYISISETYNTKADI